MLKGSVLASEGDTRLIGAAVSLGRSGLSTVTDSSGRFALLIVPTGRYRLHVWLPGHPEAVLEDVVVWPDLETEVVLRLTATNEGEIDVTAHRASAVTAGATGTVRTLTRADLLRSTARGLEDAAALMPGVEAVPRGALLEESATPSLLIRGGAPHQTGWWIDGAPQPDPSLAMSTTLPPFGVVEGLMVAPGGFNAEYGGAAGGIVHVITRDEDERPFGASEVVSDAAAGRWIGTDRYDHNVYEASIGGPLRPGDDRVTFFLAGERRWRGDRSPGFVADPQVAGFAGGPSLTFDDGRQPLNGLAGWTWLGRLAWRPGPRTRVRFGTLGAADDWGLFTQSFLFDPEHMPREEDRSLRGFASLDLTPSPRTLWSAAVGWAERERKNGDGAHFDDVRAYSRPGGNPRFDLSVPYFWETGHVRDLYQRLKASTWSFAASLTRQVHPAHQVKAGLDVQRHALRVYEASPVSFFYDSYGNLVDGVYGGYGFDAFGEAEVDGGFAGPRHPTALAGWAQDRWQRGRWVVNGGLRLESFDGDGRFLDPVSGQPIEDSWHTHLSPRLGASLEVRPGTAVRAHAGQFVQPRPYALDAASSEPERAAAVELGATRSFDDRLSLDACLYYRRIANYVETNPPVGPGSRPAGGPGTWRAFDIARPATIQGFELQAAARPARLLSGWVSYALSKAEGVFDDGQRNIAWQATSPPTSRLPLDFDRRHRLALGADVRWGHGEGPRIAGVAPLANAGLQVLVRAASGAPYTPTYVYDEVTLAAVAPLPSGETNSRRTPWTSTVDVTASRRFGVHGLDLDATLWMLNLLDHRNPRTIYSGTGSPYTTGFLATPDGQAYLDNASSQGLDGGALYRLAESRPGFFDAPRMLRLGLRASF
jgi:hypothetical protein